MPENAKDADKNRAKEQAAAQFESIAAMVDRVEHAESCSGEETECSATPKQIFEGLGYSYSNQEVSEEDRAQYHDADKAREAISEDALSVQVRSDWHQPNDEDFSKPAEFEILLCTGGPAVRIIGELDTYGQPTSAKIQYQDWFTAWEDYREAEESILLSYAQNFYFRE